MNLVLSSNFSFLFPRRRCGSTSSNKESSTTEESSGLGSEGVASASTAATTACSSSSSATVGTRFRLPMSTVKPISYNRHVPERNPPKIGCRGNGVDITDHGKTTTLQERLRTVETLDMRREADRLITLERWPVSFVDKRRVAKTGLYYYGDGDKVRCYFCNVELGEWEEGDDPATDHERWRPLCPLLRGIAFTNVPLNPSLLNAIATTNGNPPSTGVGQDVCGPLNSFEQQQQHGPVRPAFASEPSRLASFADWPCRMKQRPEAMADAGLFYTGVGDKTVCFYCGVGLKDWEDDDDPWEQHARWFPTCRYVKLVKGDKFIQEVQAKAMERTDDDNVKNTSNSNSTAGPSQSSVSSSSSGCTTSANATTSTNSVKTTDPDLEKKESSLCKICYAAERNICFVPCGHVVACPKCALAVQVCPVCRQKFTSTMRLYYS